MPVEVDAAAFVAAVNAKAGSELTEIGTADYGETNGAVYVRWPTGQESVLTRSRASLTDLERTRQVLALAQSRGLPVPRYELIIPLDDGHIIVQERLPGSTVKCIDGTQLESMLALNDRFAGLLAGRDGVPVPELRLQDPVWRESLRRYSKRSRQVLAAIDRIDDVAIVGDDLVHLDFHPENVLFDDDGSVTGVVDWDGGAARGDRRFALIKFRFELAWGTLYLPTDPVVVEQLDRQLDATIPPDLLRRYWSHWSLRMLDWTIRGLQAPEADIELHIDLALSRLT